MMNSTFSSAESTGMRVVGLEHEADLVQPQFGKRRLGELGDLHAVYHHGAAVGPVQAADQMQERGLPEPDGPAKLTHSPGMQFEIHAAQSKYGHCLAGVGSAYAAALHYSFRH